MDTHMNDLTPNIFLERATGEDTAAEAHVSELTIGYIAIVGSVLFNVGVAAVIWHVGPMAGRIVDWFPAFPHQQQIETGLFILAVATPLLNALYQILFVATAQITITTQRATSKIGVFSRKTRPEELFRVSVPTVDEPLLYRLFGRGNVTINFIEDSRRKMVLPCVKNPVAVCEEIRTLASRARRANAVRVVE